MLSFLSGSPWFAVAVTIAAAGPALIHLLNRRRFRVVPWAAMAFLQEAVQRSRRLLRFRDLLLLALRTAAIALLGLALARPQFAGALKSAAATAPVHAILLIDNSLSMGFERLDGTLLDEARALAKDLVDELPDGSRYTVLPLAPGEGISRDAYRTKEDARDAIDRIVLVDRGGDAASALEMAREAAALAPDLPAKRVVLIGDQQAAGWSREIPAALPDELGGLQIVAVAPDEPENSWVDAFYVEDGLTDLQTPAVFVAHLRHQGPAPRYNLTVALAIDGVEVASQVVDLAPGQLREVTFQYQAEAAGESGRPSYLAATVSLPPDRLPQDDNRTLTVPVVASLPVVFVDQYGDQEDPARGRYGETRTLRRLLSPAGAARPHSNGRHVRIDELDRELLANARLVVIAGVPSPLDKTPLLREFIEQGGQVLLAAGGAFDPAAWNEAGWLDGAGVLPGPLAAQSIGALPEESAGSMAPFGLAFASLSPEYFHLAATAREELEELYALPYFFKAVEIEASDDIAALLVRQAQARQSQRRDALRQLDVRIAEWSGKKNLTALEQQELDLAQHQREELAPAWLSWAQTEPAERSAAEASTAAERARPRVLARFDNQLPYLVERAIDRGRLVFVASGILSDWNTVSKTNAVLIFDRLMRAMLGRTFPPRSPGSQDRLTLPIDDRSLSYSLTRPDGVREPLPIDALDDTHFGLQLRGLNQRGIYTVTASRTVAGGNSAESNKVWETPLAASGPRAESELTYLDSAALAERLPAASFAWLNPGEGLRLVGASTGGHEMWKWLIGLVLLCLLIEFAVLGRPLAGRALQRPLAAEMPRVVPAAPRAAPQEAAP